MTMTIKEAMEDELPIELFAGDRGTITLTHDGKWIKASKNTDNNKEYHFDLTKGEFLGYYYSNRENRYIKTENITQWFAESRIITYDYKFAKLILFNIQQDSFSGYSNPARFIAGLTDKSCTNYEKWEAIGVQIAEVENILNQFNIGKRLSRNNFRTTYSKIYHTPKEIDKKIIKILQNFERPLTIRELNQFYFSNYDYKTYQILLQLCEYEKQDDYADLFLIDTSRGYESIISTGNHIYERDKLIDIILQYNLDIKRFIKYLRELKDFERTNIQWVISNYRDYLSAELFLRGGKYRKMNKYPNNLVQMHHNRTSILADIRKEKERLKKIEQQKRDKAIYASHKNLTYKPKKEQYCIIVPECADDVIEEGNKMSHCVGAYIKDISDKETFIVFMREKEFEGVPFITVEIKNDKLCTALGYSNRRLNNKERLFLQRYADKKGLEYTAYEKIEEK